MWRAHKQSTKHYSATAGAAAGLPSSAANSSAYTESALYSPVGATRSRPARSGRRCSGEVVHGDRTAQAEEEGLTKAAATGSSST